MPLFARLSLLVAVAFASVVAPASAGHTLYVANSDSDDLSALAIGADGGLAALPGSPFAGGTQNRALAFTPDGRVLYAVTNPGGSTDGPVLAYSVAGSGLLTATLGGLPAERSPIAVTVAPNGRFLYVSNNNSATPSFNGYAIGAGGALAELPGSPYAIPTTVGAAGLAIPPDGRFLYATGSGGAIYGYSLGAGGVPAALAWSPAAGVAGNARGIAVSPRGDFLVTSDVSADALRLFAIAPDGALTPNAQGPVDSGGDNPTTPAISPDGRFIYVTHRGGSGEIGGFQVLAGGLLGELPGMPIALGAAAGGGVVISADGRRLYASVSGGGNDLFAYNLAGDGSATAIAGSPFASGGMSSGGVYSLGGVRIAPNQGPAAALVASASTSNGTVALSAAASSDADGAVARYDWSFGDGATLANGGPTLAHRYAHAGSYTATVTLTDNEGCSTTQVYTGQMALCNGSAAATKSVAVRVGSTDPVPVISRLKAAKRKGDRTKVSFTLSEAARVRLTVARATPGRNVKRHCRAATRRNHSRPRCTRYVTLGSRTLKGKAGKNSVVVGAKIGKRTLSPGAYRLTLVATDAAGGKSKATRAAFTVPSPRRHR